MDNAQKNTPTDGKKCPFRQSFSRNSWIKFILVSLCYIAFTIWVGNYWLLFGLLIVADIYLTRILPWGFWKKSKNKTFRKTMEWVDAILYALIAVYFINTFFFQNYKIPTPSLEKSLLVGDYLFVSKMSYGSRLPNTPLSFPLAQHTLPFFNTKSYFDKPQWGYKRLAGFGKVKRGDIVVFNFPAGDTVALKVQNPDYYSLVYYNGREAVNRNKDIYGDIVYRPVDRRENYVKRAIGMPGDNFEVRDNQVYIDNKPLENPKKIQFNYYVMTNGIKLGERNFRELDVSVDDRLLLNSESDAYRMMQYLGFEPNEKGEYNPVYRMPLTPEALAILKGYHFVTKIVAEPGEFGGLTYPLGYNENWTRANYGPIHIPAKGETIKLSLENLPIYERVIRNYEKNILNVKDSTIFINNQPASDYTFKMDYYMMLGDNRDNSADSRSWGFVPEDHIVGKPLLIWLSLDKDRSLTDGHIRFNRLFKTNFNR